MQTGIVFIKVNGELLQSLPGARLKLGGYKNNPRVGHRFYGTSQSVETSELECTMPYNQATPIEDLRNLADAVATFETDTGIVYTISQVSTMESLELTDGEDATLSLKLQGAPAERV